MLESGFYLIVGAEGVEALLVGISVVTTRKIEITYSQNPYVRPKIRM